MPERSFSASYDSTAKAISVIVCLLLAVVAWMVHVVYIVLLFPLLIFLAYAYSPRGYKLSPDALVIRRLIGNIRVPLADIREVRAGTPDDFTGCLRLWGNGGLFGYYGLFSTSKLGKSHWYVTRRDQTAIITTANKVLVLSPDDLAGFRAAVGRPSFSGSSSGSSADPPGLQIRRSLGKIVGFGIAGLALLFMTWVFLYSPGPAGYSLTANAMTIHDRFYPVTLRAEAIDAGGVRIIDLAQDAAWRPTLRTNGFANTHYQSGWFRVANGKTVRLYRAGGNRLVLIPPKGDGAFVLYQASDPEQFARQLSHWAGRAGS